MIGIPFLMWIIFTSFDFGNVEQIFAILGMAGIILNFTKYWKLRIIKILSFILMILPLINRMTETQIEKFNYIAFQIPLLIFIITYLILIIKRNKITVGNTVYSSLLLIFLSENPRTFTIFGFRRKILADLHATKPYTNTLCNIKKK